MGKYAMDKVLILVTGMPGSGKSLVTNYFARKGFKTFIMGDIIRELVEKRGLEKTQENMMKIAEEIRNRLGRGGVAQILLERIRNVEPPIAIDGVRGIEEMKVFSKAFRCMHLIAVHSPPWLRFERIRERNRPGDPMNFEDFIQRDIKELEFGLGVLIALSDTLIINEGTKEEVEEAIEKNMERILSCGKESVWRYL